MIVIAHSGQWVISVAYLVPLVVLLIVVGVGKVRERRTGAGNPSDEGADPCKDLP
jgi:hypothetical protein